MTLFTKGIAKAISNSNKLIILNVVDINNCTHIIDRQRDRGRGRGRGRDRYTATEDTHINKQTRGRVIQPLIELQSHKIGYNFLEEWSQFVRRQIFGCFSNCSAYSW